MTILLLRPYATYPQGAIVDLDNATEASLVAQGLATRLSNQGANFAPLTSQQQQQLQDDFPAIHVLASSAGASTITRRNIATRCPIGRLQTIVNGADYTAHTQFTIEAPCDRMRIGFLNGTGADMAGCRGTVGRLSQTGNKNGATVNAGTTLDLTFGGSTTVTLAGVGGSNNDPIITWSDWMTFIFSLDRTDTATSFSSLPVHNVRLQIPSTVANRTAWHSYDLVTGWVDENLTQAPFGRIWRQREQAGLFGNLAAAAGFTSTTNISQGVPFIVQYVPRLRPVLTVMVLGNSIHEGVGASVVGFGFDKETQARISSLDRPVEICNVAVGGSSAEVDEQRALRMISDILPSLVICSAFNINDSLAGSTITAAEIDLMRLRNAAVRAECQRLGIPVMLVTGPPGTAATWPFGATDSLRLQINADMMAFGTTPGQVTLDIATPLNGPTVNGMIQMNPSLTADGTHPNTSGYQRMADVLAPVLAGML